MRKIIVQEWISADGFATDREGTTKFFEDPKYNEGFSEYQDELFERIDGVLLGATTYNMFSGFWPTADPEKEPITPKINALHKFVFSKTIENPEWQPATVCRDDVADAVRKLKNEQGKALVVWGSLSLVKRLAEENLVDEYWTIVVPVFVGTGRKFIPENKDIELELFESKASPPGAVFLKYRPK
ncbi:dihydrofolate reductase family protein [uncultured Flavobacterium sp.]|uniref:dihydrofolate reductase family protein n=1 Tax=uncultured Flavobacterium sp. TaxID=165435 RepID=UPI0025ED983A|nr:dihydrofolate reductase family protein [uncultured Flavobacterium sp.]